MSNDFENNHAVATMIEGPATKLRLRSASTRVGLGSASKRPTASRILTPHEIRTRNMRDNIAKHEADLAEASLSVGMGTSAAGRVMQLRRRVYQARQELAHLQSGANGSDGRIAPTGHNPAETAANPASSAQHLFVVKVRNLQSRSWGDQVEVKASSAKDAAEAVCGDTLIVGPGERANLRARVWPTPFGSQPDIPFYAGPEA